MGDFPLTLALSLRERGKGEPVLNMFPLSEPEGKGESALDLSPLPEGEG